MARLLGLKDWAEGFENYRSRWDYTPAIPAP